jgi:hypothetical protein
MTSGAAGRPRPTGAGQPIAGHTSRHNYSTQVPGSGSRHRTASSTHTPPKTSSARHHRTGNGHQSAGRNSPSPSSSSPAPPPKCAASQLAIQAVVGQSTYHVGDKPVVMLQVTNTGQAPCVQDLADRQIVLKVYNGESRVWGSHDCEVQPGTDDRVLDAGHPVRVSITWSGLTSEPGCAGTRHRVGAGTYTLYGYLAGHQGKATQFSIV